MDVEDWERIGLAGLVLGFLLIVFSVGVYFYREIVDFGVLGRTVVYPFRQYFLPLLVIGVSFLVVGAVIILYNRAYI